LYRYTQGHLAMTYTAICMLLTLDDDLTRLNRTSLITGITFNRHICVPTQGLFSVQL
jgi:prenyltransferase beta subunit